MNSFSDIDIIVVGSGCSGAMAAQTLVESGARVLMLDGGMKDEKYAAHIPENDFETLRRTEKQQHRYFLGEDYESLEINESGSGAQLTPARKHIVRHVDELMRLHSSTFAAVESLAYGGLGAGWGLGCCVYSDSELMAAGLKPGEMKTAYELIAGRIGISANGNDDATPFTSSFLKNHLPPLKTDQNAQELNSRYHHKKSKLNAKGFYLGQPALALLSQDYNGRKATAYDDMHFYRDAGKSAYRPGITIDELKTRSNFQYCGNQLVLSFTETERGVEMRCYDFATKEEKNYTAKKLVLAAGALSTARIVLRSFNSDKELSFLCNPYTYYPCLQWKMAGKRIEDRKTGMAQLSLFHDPDGKNVDVAMASLYTYRSLFLFRLLNEVPLNFRDAKEIMRFLLSGIIIMGIHHPDSFASNRFFRRRSDASAITGDAFEIAYNLSPAERHQLKQRERLFTKTMAALGARALKRVEPAMGASIHYAGTLPFSAAEKEFSLSPEGKLQGTKNVFVADSSGFTFLPAKGLTFSLMANAHLVASKLKA